MYLGREVFPSAPLAIVTAEMRFGYEPRLKDDPVRDRFAEAVREAFPVLSIEQAVTFTMSSVGGPEATTIPQVRATTTDRQATVTLNATSLSLAMSGNTYVEFASSFAPLMAICVKALHQAAGNVPLQRLGLRYIDEVRPPTAPPDGDWSMWVRRDLLGATGALEAEVSGHRSSTTFRSGPGRTITFNAGQFDGGTVIDAALPFAPAEIEQGPVFIIDVDSAWEPGEHTPLDPDSLEQVLAELHEPVGGIFQWSITEASRELFRQPKGETR
ncbi:TIGR04255 family protein [Cellulomonas sp. NS3]|uniref:TIGR04255 family protein n=1 Tax=Cellulomonas sp. NS3 TaxID=2973977 RepID=UPI002161331F|nr:TIGR04255 family protein [Cellulomonas sp. NS3]